MHTFARTLILYGALVLFQCGAFALLLRYSAFVSDSPVFLRGLATAALSSVLCLLSSVPALHFKVLRLFDIRDWITASSLGLMVNVVFLIVLPVTVDRSVSVFLLSSIAKSPNHSLSEDSLSRALKEIYADRFGAAQRRMKEQQEIGNIIENSDGTFALSDRGWRTLAIIRGVSSFFNLDPKFIDPPTLDEGARPKINQ